MSRILVTGSSDGIGQNIAKSLVDQGHRVTLHARNESRAKTAMTGCPGAADVLIGDLSSIAGQKAFANEANKKGAFDSIIHNAGVGLSGDHKVTDDGLCMEFAVNALAPYVLTCLMERPRNLVYMSSQLHTGGDGSLEDVAWRKERRWNSHQAYSDTKLFDVMLAFAVSRHWPDITSNAMDPGWVPTKMGGMGASGSMKKTVEMGTKLANGTMESIGTGKYFAAQGAPGRVHADAKDVAKQERFLKICEEISGVSLPK